jgi:DNA-binding LytR/AlgR family response regulator
MATLEEEWADAGFVRIHRSHLVALAHVSEVRADGGRVTVVVDGEELTVSRRHTRELRDLLVRRARPGSGGRA